MRRSALRDNGVINIKILIGNRGGDKGFVMETKAKPAAKATGRRQLVRHEGFEPDEPQLHTIFVNGHCLGAWEKPLELIIFYLL